MKISLWLAAGALLLTFPAGHAQTVLAKSPKPPPAGSVLPPPGINEPGTKPQSVPLPSTAIRPSVAPAARQHEAGQQQPDVAVTTNASGDTIQTYSRNGRVYMVRVTSKHGITQTYRDINPDGSLVHDPRLGPVSPVYYTIYQWGGASKRASEARGSGNAQPAPAQPAPAQPAPPQSGSR